MRTASRICGAIRVLYRQVPAGMQYTVEAGRRNSLDLLLPQPGEWEIRLVAVDAMGNLESPFSGVDFIDLCEY